MTQTEAEVGEVGTIGAEAEAETTTHVAGEAEVTHRAPK